MDIQSIHRAKSLLDILDEQTSKPHTDTYNSAMDMLLVQLAMWIDELEKAKKNDAFAFWDNEEDDVYNGV